MIEIIEIRIVLYRLETWRPVVSFCQHLGQGGLSAANVSGYCYVHFIISFVGDG